MNQAYVDANVILRLVTGDPPDMAEQAARLFARVDNGEMEIIIDTVAILETVWVLSSFYGFSPEQVAPVVGTLLASRGVICDEKVELLQALTLYEKKNVDFADALLAVRMMKSGVANIYSFDKHFDRFESITQLNP